MGKWLSFIVPVYNAEAYLAECIESMLRQDMPTDKYEIILIDDGSTDRSREIADDYARQYPNILVHSQANAGVTAARNAGLERATGEYVWFTDNDDKTGTNVLQAMYEQTSSNNLDILVFNACRFNEDSQWRITHVKETPVETGIEFFLRTPYNVEPWNKIFRRQFLIDHRLQFKLYLAEDAEWLPRCFYHAVRVKAIGQTCYHNRVCNSSISRSGSNQKRWPEHNLACLESHIDYMTNRPQYRFWMRALVNDTRLILWWMTNTTQEKQLKKSLLKRLGSDLRKALGQLPASPCIDYIALTLAATSPRLALSSLQLLRRTKKSIYSKS